MAKKIKIISIIAFIILLGVVWFAGSSFGLFLTSEQKLTFVILLLVIAIAVMFISNYNAQKMAGSLEASMREQADEQLDNTRPDKQEDIKELGKKLNDAIISLKTSKLAKGSAGNAALYTLPWYMFIGPPASGKTTAIENSGLNFPFSKDKKIQGVGGTRNCDWWFSNKAIFLDTAGRYMMDDDDTEEWLSFLDFLKKNRKKAPINGIMLAVSIEDVICSSEEEIEKTAARLRMRIDELIERLGIIFPVYLVFTKCDLIKGFVETFADLSKNERNQVWGSTFALDDKRLGNSGAIFEEEFDKLYNALCGRRKERLLSVKNKKKAETVFSFPVQFKVSRLKLSMLVKELFHENPYNENPMFRGFYFSSGTQEGAPIDQIISSVGRASGLTDELTSSFTETLASKAYFISDLFNEIIFPDRYLVKHSGKAKVKGKLFTRATVAVCIVGLLLYLGAISFSFIKGRSNIHNLYKESKKLLAANNDESFKSLDLIRGYLEEFDKYNNSAVSFRFGINQDNKIMPVVRKAYFKKFKSLILLPVAADIEDKLKSYGDLSTAPSDSMSLLKAYLMLTDLQNLDENDLAGYLDEVWKEGDAAGADVRKNLDYYVSQIAYEDVPKVAKNDGAARRLIAKIKGEPKADKIFASMKSRANLDDVGIEKILISARNSVLTGTYKINGIFTVEGYKGFIKKALDDIANSKIEDEWILGDKGEAQADAVKNKVLANEIRAIYIKEFSREWKKLLKGVKIRSFSSISGGASSLGELAGTASPVNILFKRVYSEINNTVAELNPMSKSGEISGILKKISTTIQGKTKVKTDLGEKFASDTVGIELLEDFKGIMAIAGAKGDVPPGSPLGQYGDNISVIAEKFGTMQDSSSSGDDAEKYVAEVLSGADSIMIKKGWNRVREILQNLDSDSRDSVRKIFEEPYKSAWRALVIKAEGSLNSKWKDIVFDSYRLNLKKKYPFNKDGEDAAMLDFVKLVKPGSGLIQLFIDNELKPFIKRRSKKIEPEAWMGKGIKISKKFKVAVEKSNRIGETLFANADLPSIKFDLMPHPVSRVSETLFKVDGKDVRYRNQPEEWYKMVWPGDGEPVQGKLQVTGDMRYSMVYDGEWGFLKLLDKAEITFIGSNKHKAVWTFKMRNGKKMKVEYTIRSSNGSFKGYKNFFNLELPDSIG